MKRFLIALMIAVGLTACGDSAEVKAKKAEVAAAISAADKQAGFHCLSSWDGSHRGVENWLKKHLRDPDSYQHVETKISPNKDGQHTLFTTYRAKNGFGGYVGGTVIATVDNETCQATIIVNNRLTG